MKRFSQSSNAGGTSELARKKGIFLLFALIAFTGFVHANFSVGEPSNGINTNYATNDFIKGWVNISLIDENSDSIFKDNFGNSISLIDLLKLNSNSNYNCVPSDCEDDYSYSNGQNSKVLSMGKNQERLLGFLLTGDNFESISAFSVKVASNAPIDTSKQLFIDILNDNSAEWQSYKASNNFYDENSGCFTNSSSTENIFNQIYCEKINIPTSPNVEIGAYVEKVSGNATFVISLEGISSQNSASCEVTASNSGRISCIPNIKIESNEDHYICIKAKSSSDNNKFKIKSETSNPCGYASTVENKRDFNIFAKPGSFVAVGEFSLNSSESQKSGGNSNIENYISNYVSERYNNNCSNGCVVPLKIISQAANHQITLSNISVSYIATGTPKEEKIVYDFTKIPSAISSGFQKLNLDSANFSILGEAGENKIYSLNFSDDKILSKNISLSQGVGIVSISPKTVVAGFPTKFTLTISNPNNLTSVQYEWNFGNNSTIKTSENYITHTYNTLGNFQLTVKAITQNNSEVSKIFTINVKTPKEAVNSLLSEKLNDLTNVNNKLDTLEEFQKSELKRTLEIDKIESDLSSIQQRNSTAQTDNDYIKIMGDLVSINEPKLVLESGKANLIPFLTNINSINLDVLKEISSSGSYEQNETKLYEDAIVLWDIENLESKISFNEFSAQYGDSIVEVLRTFEIKINENPNRGNFYFLIKTPENLEFKENYGQREALGYKYIKLDSQAQTIEFSTTDEIGFNDLPVFFSPELREFIIVSPGKITFVKERGKTLLFLIIFFVAVLGFIAYVVLQEWYKRRYEDFLFKNKNNLFNIVSYIESSKKKGTKNEDIEKGLKKVGWSAEQITYVMKKYAGERTGMFEIPIEKFFKMLKEKKDEIFKNNQNSQQSGQSNRK